MQAGKDGQSFPRKETPEQIAHRAVEESKDALMAGRLFSIICEEEKKGHLAPNGVMEKKKRL